MSGLRVVSLTERLRAQADPELIARCRELLAKAESGEINGLAAATSNADHTITTVLHTNGNHFAISHALGALWLRFQQWMAADAFESSPPDPGA